MGQVVSIWHDQHRLGMKVGIARRTVDTYRYGMAQLDSTRIPIRIPIRISVRYCVCFTVRLSYRKVEL